MSKRFKDFYVGTPVLPETFYNVLPEDYRRLAFTVSSLDKVELIKKVLSDVERGLEKFEDFNKWKDSLDPDFYSQFGEGRLKTIYRTNMSTAYTNGILEKTKVSEVATKYAFQAILDDETRDNHRACDGIVLPVNDPFWKTHTPPLGYNCRCTLIPLNEENEVEDNINPNIPASEKTADKGFGFTPSDLETYLNAQFRDSIQELPNDMRVSAVREFAKKSEVVDKFLEDNKNNFTKPENKRS